MKILQVITSLHTGGAEKLVVEFIPRLQKKGHEVAVAVFNGEDTPFMKELIKSGCRIFRLSNRGAYYNPLYIFKLIKIMRNYDIVHTHNSSPQLFVAVANMFCKKKIVTTEHSTNNRKRNYKIFLWIDKWMYRRYHKVICISDIAKNVLCSTLNITQSSLLNNILTINNGVDVEEYHQAIPIEKTDKTKRVICMVAGFRKAKDQDTLIKAFILLPQKMFELWLVGDGERREALKALVEKERLQDSVKFLGVRSDIPQILKASDIIVMSSHWEGLSLSNIEGMSVGKPFIASDVNGLREVTSGYGILFEHGDATQLAEIILKLSSDSSYYNQVATACYERAKQFDISKTVEQYDQVYQSLFKDERN